MLMRFDEFAPIHPAQRAQATDAVANGNLVGSLLLVARLHRLLDGQARLGKHLLNPGQAARPRPGYGLAAGA